MRFDVEQAAKLFYGNGETDTCIFAWNDKTGYRWYTEKQDDRYLRLFSEENGVEWAVQAGFIESDMAPALRELISAKDQGITKLENIFLFCDHGQRCWRKILVNFCYDENGVCTDYLVHVVNLDQMSEMLVRITDQMEYDELTGIYNADRFCREVRGWLEQNTDKEYAILRLDFDRFKIVNDLFGAEEGDNILRYVGHKLREISKGYKDFCFGRVISDVFAMCMSYESFDEILSVIRKLDLYIRDYPIDCRLTSAYGIYMVEDRDIPISIMLDYAKLACHSVKGNIIKNYAVYSEELREQVVAEVEIEKDMERALQEGEFKLFLQPKYDISTGSLIGAEALCRWQHPKKGLISPTMFIPLFERNGFVVNLDRYIWEETCKTIRRWLDEGREVHPVSLNVSRIHAYNNSFEHDILELVDKYQIPSQLLELELTESAYLEQEDDIYSAMNRLKEKGLLFSVDDFGTGYSSLNMLKSIPVDIVKLDREFLNETTNSEKGRTIIRNMIAMANELDMRVIAEGVESVEQAALLLEMGCELAQGYYYSKPLSVDDFEQRAFLGESKVKISSQIRSVIGEKEKFLEEMKFFRGCGEEVPQEKQYQMITNPYELRKKLVCGIKRYRKVLLGISDVLYEFNLDKKNSVVYFNKKAVDTKLLVGSYENFYQKTMENVDEAFVEYVQEEIHIDALREKYKNGEELFDISYRVENVLNKQSVFTRNVYILIGDEKGNLKEVLLCIQRIRGEREIADYVREKKR